MKEKTMPIQVEELEQPIDEEEGEQVQVWELDQHIEQIVETTDMELEQEEQDQDTNLMPRKFEVAPQSPPPPESKPVPNEKGEVVLLDDDLVMDMYNLSFDELQQRIIQARENHFLDDHASPTHMEERMIV